MGVKRTVIVHMSPAASVAGQDETSPKAPKKPAAPWLPKGKSAPLMLVTVTGCMAVVPSGVGGNATGEGSNRNWSGTSVHTLRFPGKHDKADCAAKGHPTAQAASAAHAKRESALMWPACAAPRARA